MIATLVCLLAILALQIVVPFWGWIMVVPFIYGTALAKRGGPALRTGFFAAGLLWLGAAAFFFFTGSRLIASRMAGMFGLGRPWTMIATTALAAAVAAGLAGYAGYAVRAVFRKSDKERTP
jgi:hypothetical protein